MIGFLESRYPFLQSARELAAANNATIEELLTAEAFSGARNRGVQRVKNAVEKSEVEYVSVKSDFERLMEMMSYPYARMLVSCIDDKYLTRRYALAEAVHMNKFLGEEELGVVLQIAQELNVKARLEDNKLKMHFSDFLKFSTRIKSPEWKLVNSELHSGYVFLPHEKFDRLLQNALQDRIESELPLNVPDEYRRMMSSDIEMMTNILNESKSRFQPQFSGELKTEELPPCIRTLLANAQNGINLAHSGRFALVSFLHAIGLNTEQILVLFSQSPDFDESKSIYQIKHITGELNGTDGYTPPECGTMKTNGICYEPDKLCDNEKVNHPLTYYRIKSNQPKRE